MKRTGEEKEEAKPPAPSSAAPHQLVQRLNELQLAQDMVRKRSEPGKAGKPVNLQSNLFALQWTLVELHRYTVAFDPDIPPEDVLQRLNALARFNSQLREVFGSMFVYDGATLLALRLVKVATVLVADDEKSSIAIRFIKSLSTKDPAEMATREVNATVNAVLKKFLRLLKLAKLGRNYFDQTPIPIQEHAISLFRGYTASIDASVSGLQMTVDSVHRIVRSLTVRQLMASIEADMWQAHPSATEEQNNKRIEAAVNDALLNNMVITSYNNVVYRVHSVDWKATADDTFVLPTGTKTSYREYLASKYGKKAALPAGPAAYGLLVHVPKKKRFEGDKIILCPEFCHLTGLSESQRGNYVLVKAIADRMRLSPSDRLAWSKKLVDMITQSEVIKRELDPVPLQIAATNTKLVGRILGPFKVQMKPPDKAQPVVRELGGILGQGKSNFGPLVKDCGMLDEVKPIPVWVILYEPQRDKQNVADFVSVFREMVGVQGVSKIFGKPVLQEVIRQRGMSVQQAWTTTVTQAVQSLKPLVVVGIVDAGPMKDQIYAAFKTVTCAEHPVVSQIVLNKNLRANRIHSVVGSIIKQLLTKLGGRPWQVLFQPVQLADKTLLTAQPTMLVGVDVCHDRKSGRSAVGFCATRSKDFAQYNSFVAFQSLGQEILDKSEELMFQALKHFPFQRPPHNIIVYRDGVANCQLELVVKSEITGYHAAFRRIDANYAPRLTVVIVQKRVSARFFGTEGGKITSPPAGTVVDTAVVSPHFNDFYLVPVDAHPNVGTATPTRCIVVWDDIKLSADQLQQLTAELCLMYYNWAGPVRVPAPCMYAHKIANLIGKHVQKEPSAKLTDKLYYL